jgi:RNA polymerase sigma-70 factor (ECF subfamily)
VTDTTVTAAVAGDQAAFTALAERHRRELHVHCYRMLASYDDADDALQETYLRAWRHRDQFGGDSLFRAWLYRIATNVCLDMLRRRGRRANRQRSGVEVSWLQPYPDTLLDEVVPADDAPDEEVVGRETIELAFLIALQVLPPRQRAALILRDVLGHPAAETASLLDTSVAAANSALQRARATMAEHLPSHRLDWSARAPSPAERDLLARFIDAHQRCDADAAVAAVADDIRVTMPPYGMCFEGVDEFWPLVVRATGDEREGDWRLLPTGLNRMPAAASYLRRPGDAEFRPFKLDVLRVEEAAIAEITTFGYALFPALGLPASLPPEM